MKKLRKDKKELRKRGYIYKMQGIKGFFSRYKRHIMIGLISGALNGLFGAGGGSVVVPAMERFLDIDEKKSHATAILIILIFSLISSFIYIKQDLYDLGIFIYSAIGGAVGGPVGAKLLKNIPKKWLKIVFGGVIIITAVKMIMD